MFWFCTPKIAFLNIYQNDDYGHPTFKEFAYPIIMVPSFSKSDRNWQRYDQSIFFFKNYVHFPTVIWFWNWQFFFAECLDCVLTTHKMYNMLTFQVNISIIILFICKKNGEKRQKSNYLKTWYLQKKLHLKSIRAHNFQDIFTKFIQLVF